MDDLTGPEQQSSPPWVWAVIVALSLVVITTGAIVGMVTTDDEGGEGNSPEAAASDTGTVSAATAPLVPPTVSIPALTEPPTDTGGFVEPIPPLTTPPATTATTGASTVGTWPAGQSGYTVIVASIPQSEGRARADAAAQRAITAGLPAVGVLFSSDYSSLRPGFWVTYTGVYTTLAQAQAALPQAQGAGFSSAYTRTVRP